MVQRGLAFFKEYPVVADGITFKGGYTDIVDTGDGDFLTQDTVRDFKINRTKPSKDHMLQICMYWLMGLHSIHAKQYENVSRLGFFNQHSGEISTISVADLDKPMLHEIETLVIGYDPTEAIVKTRGGNATTTARTWPLACFQRGAHVHNTRHSS